MCIKRRGKRILVILDKASGGILVFWFFCFFLEIMLWEPGYGFMLPDGVGSIGIRVSSLNETRIREVRRTDVARECPHICG